MERQKKILDASIIVKWFLKEEKREGAIALRQAHINDESVIIVPEFLFLEVLNVLRYKKWNEHNLKEANKSLWDNHLIVESVNQFMLEKALKISLEYNLTLYDSIYAALSQIHDCPLITEDEKLKKFPSAVTL